ncbi:hypothetical protein NQZ68_020975 [Dissostichus eleginoides]|nr:hypothetical protein NQZ68_020975 [Dissostichus eleginoides]
MGGALNSVQVRRGCPLPASDGFSTCCANSPSHPGWIIHPSYHSKSSPSSRVAGGSTVGVVLSASCSMSLSQGQFGQPMALTPPKQAVTANPPPSPSNPRQSWANPKLIQGHSQLGVSHRAMPGHQGHSGQAMIQ